MARQKSKFDAKMWIRLNSETKDALQKQADDLGVDLSVVGRWALERAVDVLAEAQQETVEAQQE